MSALEDALLSSRPEVSIDSLKAAAASAARGYLHKSASLNESIAESARELKLNSHQIDRVAQAANTLVFKAKFAASADNKVVEFPVADPAVIKKIASVVPATNRPSTVVVKTAAYIPGADAARRNAPAKVKEANYGTEDFTGELSRVYMELTALKPQAAGDVTYAKTRVKTAGVKLVQAAGEIIESGEADFYDVVDAISQVARIPSLVKVAADMMAESLLRNGGLRVSPGFEKRAGRRADPKNPICVSYLQLEDALVDVQARQQVLDEIVTQSGYAKEAVMGAVGAHEHMKTAAAAPGGATGWQKFLKAVGMMKEEVIPGTHKVENYTHAARLGKARELAEAPLNANRPAGSAAIKASESDVARRMKDADSLLGDRFTEVANPTTKHELTAFGKGARIAGIVGGIGVGAHLAAGAYEKSKEKMLSKGSFNKAISENKDLHDLDKKTLKKNFDVLWKFSPDMAMQPTVAGSFLRQTAFRSELGIDPNTVKMLADIQKSHSEAYGAHGKASVPGMVRNLAGVTAGIG